jgi:hypothetical protein
MSSIPFNLGLFFDEEALPSQCEATMHQATPSMQQGCLRHSRGDFKGT